MAINEGKMSEVDVFEGLRSVGIQAESYTNGRVVIAGHWMSDRAWEGFLGAVGGFNLPQETNWAAVALAACQYGELGTGAPQSPLVFSVHEITRGHPGKYDARKGRKLASFRSYERAVEWAGEWKERRFDEFYPRIMEGGPEGKRAKEQVDRVDVRVYAALAQSK